MNNVSLLQQEIKAALDKAFLSTDPSASQTLSTELAAAISKYCLALEVKLTYPDTVQGVSTCSVGGGPLITFAAATTLLQSNP